MNKLKKVGKTPALNSKIGRIILIALVASVALGILRLFAAIIFFDNSTGLMYKSAVSNVLTITYYVGLIAVIALSIIFCGRSRNKNTKYIEEDEPNFIFGTAYGIIGVALAVEGVINILNQLAIRRADRDLVTMVVASLAIFSAVSFFVRCFYVLKLSKNANIIFSVIPIVWGIGMAVETVVSVTTRISMQDDVTKVLLCSFAMMFLLCDGMTMHGYNKGKVGWLNRVTRLIFPCIAIMSALPYAICNTLGMYEKTITIPYFSLCAIGLYSIFALLKYSSVISVEMDKTENSNAEKI